MIKAGDIVEILPEWQDEGDSEFTWVAIEDEDGGRVKVKVIDSTLVFAPIYVMQTDWLKAA